VTQPRLIFLLLIELFEHVLNYFQRKKIEEERKRIPAKVKMGWEDYTFTTLEMCYAGDAIEVSSFQYPSSTRVTQLISSIFRSIQ
jgi:hypothetical protein